MSDVGAKLMDDQIDATSASLTFSFLFLLLGVIATVVLSATSKRPFANGFALVMIIQAFLLSFILSAVSAVHIHSAVASDHGSRTLILFVLFFQCAASSNPSPAPFWPPHGCSHPPPGFHSQSRPMPEDDDDEDEEGLAGVGHVGVKVDTPTRHPTTPQQPLTLLPKKNHMCACTLGGVLCVFMNQSSAGFGIHNTAVSVSPPASAMPTRLTLTTNTTMGMSSTLQGSYGGSSSVFSMGRKGGAIRMEKQRCHPSSSSSSSKNQRNTWLFAEMMGTRAQSPPPPSRIVSMG